MESAAVTLVEYLDRWAMAAPDHAALSQGEQEWTYSGLHDAVCAGQQWLDSAGVRPGDRVALVGQNSASWVVAFLATLRVGGVVVPVNYRVSAKQLISLVEDAQPVVVLTDEAGRGALATDPLPPTVAALEAFLSHLSASCDPVSRVAHDPALISFTSGTTGTPKGAVISHGAMLASALAFDSYLGLTPQDRTTTLVPLFHNTGYLDQLAHMLTVGGALDVLPQFHTRVAVETLIRRPAQYLATVPSILRLLMLHPAADDVFRPCRVITFGGAPMPPAWSQEMADRWPHLRLMHGYGLTEFTSATHILPAEDLMSRGESVGPPLPGVDCQIWDVRGEPVPVGTLGEVVVAGAMRMDGYWRRPEETADKIRGRWLRTGDLGRIDADGYLTIEGRATEVINRGGEKIHPNQLEAVLTRVPSVAECAVVSGPHPVLQERVLAAVTPHPGSLFDEAQARALLAEEVPDYAIPESFVVTEALPHNAAGKLDRPGVQALVLAALGLDYPGARPPAFDPPQPTAHTLEAPR